jgi:hypothetical protein
VYCLGSAHIVIGTSTVSNNAVGIRCDDSNPLIAASTVSGNNGGIVCQGTAFPMLRASKVWNNANGISFADASSADMQPCGGVCPVTCGDGNSFKGNTGFHVSNLTQDGILAGCNYWGKAVPVPGKFYGTVYYSPYLGSDPLPSSPASDLPTVQAPRQYALHGAMPNPFNPSTTVRYDVPEPGGRVRVRVYDVRGQLVRSLVDGTRMRASMGLHGTARMGVALRSRAACILSR